MELIETDIEGPRVDPNPTLPPRPERRRVSVSLAFTVIVLTATVALVYKTYRGIQADHLQSALNHHGARAPTAMFASVTPAQFASLAKVAVPKWDRKLAPGVTISNVQMLREGDGARVTLLATLAKDTQNATILLVENGGKPMAEQFAFDNLHVTRLRKRGALMLLVANAPISQDTVFAQ